MVLHLLTSLFCAAVAQEPPVDDAAFYARSVQPILAEHCFECHGDEGRPKAGLRLTSRSAFLAGGDSGPVQVGDGPFDASALLEAIGYEDEFLQMPPNGKLSADSLAILRDWIARGAPYDAQSAGDGAAPGDAPAEQHRITRGDGLTGWAYRPVAAPDLSQALGSSTDAHPIDALVRAKLVERGLAPNPRADEATLVRRVYLDLTGLAPSPEEVAAYLGNDDPQKWAELIERLLASPQYGERWGRHWLDVVRYAETNGFERDSNKPHIWRYRDWVVDAFNADMPYDEFVRDQLAGDELPDRDRSSIIGSGYLRLSQWDDEPGAGALQGRYDVLDDIVSTTSQAFLGSTIGCARCHDHKADPFDAEHYYQFMAFFHGLTDMSTGGTLVDVSSPEEAAVADEAQREKDAELAALQAERRAIVDALQARTSTAGTVRGPLERLRYRFYRDTWAVLPDFEMFRPEDMGELEAGFVDLALRTRDNAIGFVFEGLLRVPRDGEYEFRARADDGARVSLDRSSVLEIDGLGDEPRSADARRTLQAGAVPMRVEWFNARGAPTLELDWRRVEDARWRYATAAPGGAPAAWTSATFDDSAWSVGEGGFGAPGTPGADVRTEWHEAEIWLRRTFDWDAASGGDPCVVLHHDEDVEVYVNGVLALERDGFASEYATYELSSEGRAALRAGENLLAVHCRQTGGGQYVDVAIVPRAATMDGRTLRDVALGRAPLSAAQPAATEEELTRLVEARGDALLGEGTLERYRALSERIRRTRERPVPRAMAFAARERGGEVPPLAIHVRGNANLLGEPVEPAVPAFLGDFARPVPQALPDGSSSGRRAALARWITAPENPLTARVMVNRVWQHHFGRGIVPSTNDFGELGDRPSNLPLLDWLAHEFVARGWSVKALHRLILSSETWRQSAAGRPEALVVDPENDCLWRMSPRRMSAEEVRDGMLAVAGMLRLERGGPSVFGRMPKAALATSSTPGSVWGESPEAQQNRRTLYIKVKRSLLTPLLVAHDMPDVDSSCPARFTTILPTQALQLLNGDFPHEVAQRFADRLEAELPGPDAQAGRGSGATGDLLAGRVRRGLELALARPVADAEVSDYAAFLTALAADEALTPRRALELFCLTVLNLNEFVFVD